MLLLLKTINVKNIFNLFNTWIDDEIFRFLKIKSQIQVFHSHFPFRDEPTFPRILALRFSNCFNIDCPCYSLRFFANGPHDRVRCIRFLPAHEFECHSFVCLFLPAHEFWCHSFVSAFLNGRDKDAICSCRIDVVAIAFATAIAIAIVFVVAIYLSWRSRLQLRL